MNWVHTFWTYCTSCPLDNIVLPGHYSFKTKTTELKKNWLNITALTSVDKFRRNATHSVEGRFRLHSTLGSLPD